MKSIDFPQSNNVLPTKAGNMPVFIGASGEVISRWQFTWKEAWQFIRGNRSIFIVQHPDSIAFPQLEMTFRELTEEEKANNDAKQKEAELEAKKKAVIDARNQRNPNRLRRLRDVAREQGMYKPSQNETKAQKETL